MFMKKAVSILIVICLLMSANVFASDDVGAVNSGNISSGTDIISNQSYYEGARDRYIQGLADSKNITVEEAKILDQQENIKILIERNGRIGLRASTEEIRYSTQRGYYTIDRKNNTKVELS
ncbi:MAG: hypothetical protein ACK5LT_09055 [Lachnospirales bacterium]